MKLLLPIAALALALTGGATGIPPAAMILPAGVMVSVPRASMVHPHPSVASSPMLAPSRSTSPAKVVVKAAPIKPVSHAVPLVKKVTAPVPVVPPAPVTLTLAQQRALRAANFTAWLAHPTFTCPAGRAPGWLNEQGIPTSCVAN